ncbi:AAA family ATPase [Pseudomonas sp. A2]|uniref:ATP-dependent nuclease n=1 Tax=Pseudomonas sp. A2 TaxID=107445 RepID=UPI001FFEBA9F|nr:AAA family ATPase [Pseudomonas sp. A2]UPK84381.1 ATP-dependent endonuclease [Pseudomonas sp. A2]
MKLKSLKIENFRAIRGGSNILRFEDNDIVFIFGKNNIGKSSILRAYEYFASPNKTAAITDFYEQNSENPIIIEAAFLKEDLDEENFDQKGLNKWVCKKTGEIHFRKTWDTIDAAATKQTLDPETGEYVSGGFGGLEPILTNATPAIIFIEAMPSIKSLTEWLEKEIKNKLLKKLKDNHAAEYGSALDAIKKLQEKVEGADYLGEISNGANKYFAKTFPELELRITTNPYKDSDIAKAIEKDFNITIGNKPAALDEEKVEEDLAAAVLALEDLTADTERTEGVEKRAQGVAGRQFDLHGHGLIRQAIINILGIFKESQADKKHIILFEEPELYLHPSNKRRFRDTLYDLASQDAYQIICVSHDPQLIDLNRPHISLARFVKCSDGETRIYQAGHDLFCETADEKDRLQMLNRFNPHICESFFADEVVLVEGDTEAIIMRELLETHHKNGEVFVLNTGSKTNMPFFIKILRHFYIKQHVIHDADERYIYNKGAVVLKDDQTPKRNGSWTLNQTIWDELQLCNVKEIFAKRYVSIRNFEHAHGYVYNKQLGKPLSAHQYAKDLDFEDTTIPIVQFARHIIGCAKDAGTDYSPEFLEATVVEPY